MSLVIELTPEEEKALEDQATSRNTTPEEYARRMLHDGLRRKVLRIKSQAALEFLRAVRAETAAMSEEEQEQAQAEGQDIARLLNENRLSFRARLPETDE